MHGKWAKNAHDLEKMDLKMKVLVTLFPCYRYRESARGGHTIKIICDARYSAKIYDIVENMYSRSASRKGIRLI
jgi:hypothetical protein